jgi:hypothetical protein
MLFEICIFLLVADEGVGVVLRERGTGNLRNSFCSSYFKMLNQSNLVEHKIE